MNSASDTSQTASRNGLSPGAQAARGGHLAQLLQLLAMVNPMFEQLDPTTTEQKKTLSGALSKVKKLSRFLPDAVFKDRRSHQCERLSYTDTGSIPSENTLP